MIRGDVVVDILSVLFLGVLTVKERCHGFECRIEKELNRPCQVYFDGSKARLLGVSMPVKKFMSGNYTGYDGNNGYQEVTLFFKGSTMFRAYVLEYYDKDKYHRWTCIFKNKRACLTALE
jgi:hypothetical protein